MLPACEGPYGVLPSGIHQASLDEVCKRFVDQAPLATRERRELIFDAVHLHAKIVTRLCGGSRGRMWINGGFTTHKEWPRRDADLAFFVAPEVYASAHNDSRLPLWTLGDVKATVGGNGPKVATDKLQHDGWTDGRLHLP